VRLAIWSWLEAINVDAKQDLDAVAGLPAGLTWGHSPIEPGEQVGVAEVAGPGGSYAPSPQAPLARPVALNAHAAGPR